MRERNVARYRAFNGTCLIISALCVGSTTTVASQPNIFRLPAGEYRLDCKGISQCAQPSDGFIRFDYYLSKTSANTTEIRGNAMVGNGIAIDDSLDIEFKLAVRDSNGGWKDNAFAYKSPNACSKLKYILGNVWIPFMAGLGFKDAKCPIVAGTYSATGADTALIARANFPKTFFYGTYRFHVTFSKKNANYGCLALIVELKRPRYNAIDD